MPMIKPSSCLSDFKRILSCVVLAMGPSVVSAETFSPNSCPTENVAENIFKSEFDCSAYFIVKRKEADNGGPNDVHNSQVTWQRYEREVFAIWLFQQTSYGNISSAKDLLPGLINVEPVPDPDDEDARLEAKRFRWLIMNEDRLDDPAGKILSCTLESIQEDLKEGIPTNLEYFEDYVDADDAQKIDLVKFWIAYDLVLNQAQNVLSDTRGSLLESGSLNLDDAGRAALASDLVDGRCALMPMLEKAVEEADGLNLPDEQKLLMEDAADLAQNLWTAVDFEIGFELELAKDQQGSADAEPEGEQLAKEVNRQLHCETLATDPLDKDKKEPLCDGLFGAVSSKILVPAGKLGEAFSTLEASINTSAESINLLNADLMKIDRNLLTYSEVFADFDQGQMQETSAAALQALETVLKERELIEISGAEGLWKALKAPHADKLTVNEENPLFESCDGADCAYCEITEPLSKKNLEQYLVCFHIKGVAEAESHFSAVESGASTPIGGHSLFNKTCDPEALMSSLPPNPETNPDEAEEDRRKRDSVITECFIDWVWDYDPATAFSFEASVQE